MCLKKYVRRCADGRRKILPMIPIAGNFAGATLRQIDVAEKMTALIEKYHVSCEYLEVEVSESYSDMESGCLHEDE